MNLNASQQLVVEHTAGPLLIVAGAGTGKTTVLTERIRHLIQHQSVPPDAIFAATFTQKAAEELLARLGDVMPLGYQEPWVGTFHSLCDRLLKHEGLEIGIDPHFRIMTATDQWMFIKEHLFDFDFDYYRPLGNPTKFISALITYFSRLADEVVSVEAFQEVVRKRTLVAQSDAAHMEATRLEELANAYARYVELKHMHSVMDFGDLITETIRLLRSRPQLARLYGTRFAHVMVDEFQDTNYAQYELIQLLKPPLEKPNLLVVGDDDQAIYRFRGASVSNILDFKDRYADADTVVLTDNYRSTQRILDASYASIQANNPDRLEERLTLDKRLVSHTQEKGEQRVLAFAHVDEEVAWTVAEILRLVDGGGIHYHDIAILTRSNAQLEPYAQLLRSHGIPYQLVSNRGLFDQVEVVDLITLLQVLVDPHDSMALFHLAASNFARIPAALLLEMMREVRRTHTSLWDLMEEHDAPVVQALVTFIKAHAEDVHTSRVTTLLHDILETSTYLQTMVESESLTNQLQVKNLSLFFERVAMFEKTADRPNAVAFLDRLDEWLDAGDNPAQAQIEDVDTISLMTVHASKGLEYDAVFVGSMIAGRFPSMRRKDPIELPEELIQEILPTGDPHMQEERRLFYVAMTRAKRYLYLTYARSYGGARERKPSGFLAESGLPIEAVSDTGVLSATQGAAISTPYLAEPVAHSGIYSYSQLDTFLVCPQKYKYRYLLHVPARPHHALSFGQTIHATLYDFHRQQQLGKDTSLEELLAMYERHFIPTGYDSAAHKEARFQAGKQALAEYVASADAMFGAPYLLEQSFSLQLGDEGTLVGKIDRIDKTVSGYELIDYKTGSAKTQRQVDRDEQLTIYALAAREALGIDIVKLHLYFIEDGTVVTTERSGDQLDKAYGKLMKQIVAIRESDFPAKPGSPFPCGYCPYKTICPHAKI